MTSEWRMGLIGAAFLTVSGATSAVAQDAEGGASGDGGTDIVVTAQKRSERLSDVPISVTAVTGSLLANKNITSANDLERVVPGFTYQAGMFGTPVFTIRGVGFYENSLAVAPAVSVYLDQVPLPFLAMASGVSLDLERVEALKGPQGTLFGQNSTGGAINYIAAKPLDHFEGQSSAEYGRFNDIKLTQVLTGPISDTLRARVAVRAERRGGWQKSYTRDDTLGRRNFLTGRLTLEWEPSDRTKISVNLNGWRDRSETPAAQFRQLAPTSPAGRQEAIVFLGTYPLSPANIRSADWDANTSLKRRDRFYQAALRGDFEMSDTTTLTSITSYSNLRVKSPLDADGVNYLDHFVNASGYIRSFSQELRASGNTDAIRWMVGGNVQTDSSLDEKETLSKGSNQAIGPRLFTGSANINKQQVSTWAAFASVDVNLTDQLTVLGSVRYTDQDRNFSGCLADRNGGTALAFAALATQLSGIPTVIAPGACLSLDAQNRPGLVRNKLNQDNLSWRAGLNWKPNSSALFYANITKGYKAGSFGTLAAIRATQFTPVTQESVLAYEVGAKQALFDRRVQLSAAAFYYDYKEKQILGTLIVGPPFGSLPGLINVPESRVKGAEIEIRANPSRALTLMLGATYVDSAVKGSTRTPDPYGVVVDINGEAFPNTPKWQIVGDAEYRLAASSDLDFVIGAGFNSRTSSYAAFGKRPLFKIEARTLVDARAAIESHSGGWRLGVWGRNITNKRYIYSAYHTVDTIAQLTGMPATYGLSFSIRY